ncbi:MAG: hypothetical protein AAB037_00895, partial [Chloroflexota bacterium]
MTALEKFSSWIGQAILAWRDQTRLLAPEYHAGKRGPIFRFDIPCQVDVLHLLHRYHRLDFRLCVIRHFEDEPDLKIRVLGPHQPVAFPEAVETYISSPFWDRQLPDDDVRAGLWSPRGSTRYREAMEYAIWNAYTSVHTYINNTIKSEGVDGRSYGMVALPGGCWAWGIAGAIEQVSPDASAYIAEQITRDLHVEEARASAPKIVPQPSKRRGLGAFLLPMVWVGEGPKLSLRERLEGVRPALVAHREIVVSTSYAGIDLLVTRSGCFILATEDREQAAAILNEIFSMALFMDESAMSVAPTDLVTMSDIDWPFTSYEYEGTLSPLQQARLEGNQSWSFDMQLHPVLPSSRIEAIVKATAQLSADPRRALVMRFTLDAWSHLNRRDYRNAFLFAWTGIELTVNSLWARQQGQKAVRGQRRSRPLSWQAGRVLKALQLIGVISSASFKRLDRARDLLNSVLHSGSAASPQDARNG